MAWVSAVIGGVQLINGYNEKQMAKSRANSALARRKAYQTPAEVLKQLNATEQRSQSGFDPETLQYLTSETDRSFDAALSTSEKLGGDPNDLSYLFNNKVNNLMKIGAENHAQNLNNFNSYLNALTVVGQGKDAEFFSGQNIVKDQLQAAYSDKVGANAQISAGLNTLGSAVAQYEEGQLYKEDNPKEMSLFKKEYGDQGKNAYDFAKKNKLTFDQYKSTYNSLPDFSKLN